MSFSNYLLELVNHVKCPVEAVALLFAGVEVY